MITAEWLRDRYGWSLHTFGIGRRTHGIIAHIKHELEEIEAAPTDVTEWCDVLLLAFDGAQRAGHSAETVLAALRAKHRLNAMRKWGPVGDEDKPVFHVKGND